MTNMEGAVMGAEPRPVHPALQLLLMLAPIAMNGFFLVYALVGVFLDGKEHLRWSGEALSVASWICFIMLGYSLFLYAIARLRQLRGWCLLNIAAVGHAALAVALLLIVKATV